MTSFDFDVIGDSPKPAQQQQPSPEAQKPPASDVQPEAPKAHEKAA